MDVPTNPLSGLKKGESYSLPLSSSATLKLYEELTGLYGLAAREGIPPGQMEFVRSRTALAQLVDLPPAELRRFLEANRAVGSSLVSRLLDWALRAEDLTGLVELLVDLGSDGLRTLNTAVGIQTLKTALRQWRDNLGNTNEEYWQEQLTKNSFVLEYVFSWPCTIVKDKAYVGGKSVSNKGGKIVDYLVKNRITSNAALIEIKTPAAGLLGKQYRDGVFVASDDLAGGVAQVTTYKQSLLNHHQSLTEGQQDLFESFDPQCVVLVGDAGSSLKTIEQRRSFELYRNQLLNVSVITFDELFKKMELLVAALEAAPIAESAP